jgi:hypothetical protein
MGLSGSAGGELQTETKEAQQMKKVTAACLIVLAAYSLPAYAASEDDCDRSWSAYDINRDGVLRGAEAQRFTDDMRAKGVIPGSTRNGEIHAKAYKNACIKDFWSKLEEEER